MIESHRNPNHRRGILTKAVIGLSSGFLALTGAGCSSSLNKESADTEYTSPLNEESVSNSPEALTESEKEKIQIVVNSLNDGDPKDGEPIELGDSGVDAVRSQVAPGVELVQGTGMRTPDGTKEMRFFSKFNIIKDPTTGDTVDNGGYIFNVFLDDNGNVIGTQEYEITPPDEDGNILMRLACPVEAMRGTIGGVDSKDLDKN